MSPALRLAGGLAVALCIFPLPPASAYAPDVSQLQAIPLAMVRAPLAKRIEAVQDKTQPYQFAVKVPLALTLADGIWDQLDADTARWRLRVSSPGAQSLNFEFARFHLPPGASLWIYDTQARLVQGPYTAANETPEGKLWTAVVLGEQAVLELKVPWSVRDQVALALGSVGHGFRGFGKDSSAPAKSGGCNIDVVCPQGDNWRSEIRSVARIQVDSSFLCTGQLVNNQRQNDDPLFVTANHCSIGQAGCGTGGNQTCSPSSVVFYWNFFNDTCRSTTFGNRTGNGSLSQNQTGSTLLAGDVGSDFTLVRLNQAPRPEFNVYFAGWDAGNAVPQSGVTIHHPSGDKKSISVFSAPAQRGTVCIAGTVSNCLRTVQGWGVHWTQGTTEEGSSGGGLWDENHHVVGWLSGGDASCSNQGGEDFFGRMEVAWTAGAQQNQQLKFWLDPDNTGGLSLAGRDPASTNHNPTAANDAATVSQGSAETLIDVLANDADVDGDPLTITALGATNHGGIVAIRSSGTRVGYAPAAGFAGTETFNYTIGDGRGGSASATVTVTVNAPAPSGGGGGGGALAPGALLLLAAAALRRRGAHRPD